MPPPPPDLPPHPGPRPHTFEFPFAAAQAAVAEIDRFIGDLAGGTEEHHSAADVARVGFEGETREGFDRGLEEFSGRLDDAVSGLRGDRDVLEDGIEEARRLREASLDAVEQHDADLGAYEAALRTYEDAQDAEPAA